MKKIQLLLNLFLFAGLISMAQSQTTVNVPNIDNTFDPNAGFRGSSIIYNDSLFVRSWANPKNVLAKYNEAGNTLSPLPLPPGILAYLGSPIIYGTSLYGLYSSSGATVLAKYNNGVYTVFANPDAGPGLQTAVPPVEYQGSLYFSYQKANNKFALAKFDGTNLTLIANPDNNQGFASNHKFIIFNSKLYFAYNNPNGPQVAEYDGTAITLYNNPDNGFGIVGEYVAYNGNLYFNYINTSNQHQLAKFNGTSVSLILNIPAAAIGIDGDPIVYNNKLCYAYSQEISSLIRRILAVFDGTNTTFINNPDSASSGLTLGGFSIFNGMLYAPYFTAAGEAKLFSYDGNSSSLISDPAYPNYIYSNAGPVFNNKLVIRGAFPPTYTKINLAFFDGVKFDVVNNARPADPGPMDVDKAVIFHNKFFFRNDSLALFFTIPNLAYVGPPVSLITTHNVTCNGGNDGWAKATPPPCGAGINTYLWTPGNQTTDSIGGLTAGSYSVRIICGTDTLNQAFTITEPSMVNPPTTSNQSFCGNAKVADLVATGSNIKWYAAATGGSPLAATTALTDGTKYYASQTTGGCESGSRAADSVTVVSVTSPVVSNQSFCVSATVADLVATGTNIKWYLTPTGGSPLTATTPLTDGTKYYATQTSGSCESAVRAVDSVTITNPSAPAATSLVIYTGNKTLNQLSIPGSNLQFYTSASGGTALPGTSLVSDDSTYYVTQTINGCESGRKKITVNRIANDTIVLCNPATVSGLTATPQTGNTAQWFNVATGGTALSGTTAMPAGQNTFYVEETNPGTTVTLLTYTAPVGDFASQLNSMTLTENDSLFYGLFNDSAKLFRANPDGSNPTIVSKGLPGESIRYMEFETDATGRYLLYTTQNLVKRRNLSTGAVTTVWTSPTNPGFNLKQVSRDIANNKLYVSDAENGRIKLVDLATNTAVTVDSLAKVQFGASFFTARPFAVCYSAPNTLYFSDFERNRIYRKNIATGVRTDSMTFGQARNIHLLPDGKLLIIGESIITVNADLTGSTTLVPGLGAAEAVQFNSNGELVYADYRSIKKLTTVQSNRVPVTVIVNPTPTVTATADKVICNNSTVAAVNFSTTTTGGTVSYSWTNNKTSIGLAASGTGNIASFTGVNNGTTPDTATVIVTPTITNGGVNCTGTPDTFLIIVNPVAKINAISDRVECNGSAVSAIIPTSTATGGIVSYTWTNDNTSIGLAAGGTGSVPAFTATNTGVSAITATVIVTPTFTANGISCNGISDTFTITVNPPPLFNATADKTVCVGPTSAINFTTPLTGGSAVYTWTNSNTAIGLAASGSGSVPGFNANNTGTAPIFGEIVVSMAYTNAGLTCTSLKDTFAYYVNPVASVNAVSSQVLCNNSITNAVNFSSPNTGGVVTYSWINSNPGIGLGSTGTGNISSFTATNNGDTPAVATITVTPSFTSNGVICTGTSRSFTITVNPTAQVNNITSQVVCNNSSTTAVNFSTTRNGGTTTYAWTNNNSSIGLAANGSGNIAVFTATNSTTAPVTATITVTPTYTNAGVSCTGPSKTFTITVNPTATVNTVSNQVLCNNTPAVAVNFSSPATGGTVSYNWTNNNTNIGLASSGSGNISSFTATNTSNAPLVATITVTPAFTNAGVSCTGTARQFTITVNPTVSVNPISNKVECNGSVIPAETPASTATGGTVTYTWTNSNTAIGLSASGTGNIPSFTATNTTNAPLVATITVTPTFTNGGISCSGTPLSYTITVNPPPVFNATTNQVACNGSATSAISFTTPLTGGIATFAWTNNNPAIGLATSGSGNLPGFTAINTTNAPISATISVVMTYSNAGSSCTSLPQTFTYVVNPTAKVNPVNNQALCNRALTAPVSFSSPTTGGTIVYNWVNNTPGIGLAPTGTGNIPAFTAVNNTAGVINATVTVTPTFSNAGISCSGTPVTFTITVNPTPVTGYTVNNAAQCFTGNQFIFTNTSTGAAGYTWSLGDATSATTVNLTKSYASPGSYNVKLVSVNGFGCSDSITKIMTVYPQPQKPVVTVEFGNGIHSSVISNSYTWFNNNVALNNSNSQYFYPVAAGYQQVQVTTINGCSAKSDSLYYIPEKNSTAGVDKQFVFVYPLPVTNGSVNIHFNEALQHKVICRLYTDLGQLLQTVEIPTGTRQFKLDVSKYAKATYVIRFDDFYNMTRGVIVPIGN